MIVTAAKALGHRRTKVRYDARVSRLMRTYTLPSYILGT
jgi:hypothetical protein